MNLRMFVIVILIALSAIFIVQNVAVVEVHFLIWQLEMSRALMIIFLVLIGVVVGWLLRGHALHRARDKKK